MGIVLALAMVVPGANRRRGVLWILVPVLMVALIWLAVVLISKPVTSDREMFGAMALSLAAGSAVLWLLGHALARCARSRALALALGIALGVALVGTFWVQDFSRQTIGFASMLIVVMLAMVLAYVPAARMSHDTYRPVKFLLLLGAWTAAFSAVGMPLWFLFGSAVTGRWPTSVPLMLGAAVVGGAIMGACAFLVSLIFLLVGLRSPLFRPRLFACLRLPPGPAPAGAPTVADLHQAG